MKRGMVLCAILFLTLAGCSEEKPGPSDWPPGVWMDLDLRVKTVRSITVTPKSILVAGGPAGVYRRERAASSPWTFLGLAQPQYASNRVLGTHAVVEVGDTLIAAVRDTAAGASEVYLRSITGDTAWHQSNIGGPSIRPRSMVTTSNGNIVIASATNGMFLSSDNGHTWSRKSYEGFVQTIRLFTHGGTVLAAGMGALFGPYFGYSLDNGLSWTFRNINSSTPFIEGEVISICGDIHHGDHILLSLLDPGGRSHILRTTADGLAFSFGPTHNIPAFVFCHTGDNTCHMVQADSLYVLCHLTEPLGLLPLPVNGIVQAAAMDFAQTLLVIAVSTPEDSIALYGVAIGGL